MPKLQFKPIELSDKECITSITLGGELQNCDLSFANMCSWRFLYDSEYAIHDGFLFIRFKVEEKKHLAYMRPLGNGGDFRAAVRLQEEDALSHGHPLCFLGVTPVSKELLEKTFPGEFMFKPQRDFYDYIYLREDLATLRGKKYQAKRNHVNKFRKEYNYEYVSLTQDIVDECLDFESRWYEANRTEDDSLELKEERQSMTFALHHYKELDLKGGAIRVDGKLVAFSFGAPINRNTFGVHVEKADTAYDGSYSIINQEFASHIPERFTYLNREEDLGLSGLRQAKLSYNPVILLEKYMVVQNVVGD